MKEKKTPVVVAAIVCVVAGAAGSIVGYRAGGFHCWPMESDLSRCIIFGSAIGIFGAAVTGFFLMKAARQALWIIALFGCVFVFGSGYLYGQKQANDLHAWMFGRDFGK